MDKFFFEYLEILISLLFVVLFKIKLEETEYFKTRSWELPVTVQYDGIYLDQV